MLNKKKIIKSLISKIFESGNFIIIIGILTVLPFLVISIFNNPSADDFCYNNFSRDWGYLNTQIEAYYNWTGRYFSTAIMSIRALVSGSFYLYKLIPIILLMLLFLSFYHLSSSIFNSLSRKAKYVLTFLLMILYLLQMPSTSQGFYWLPGSVTYQLSIILSVFLFSFVIKYLETLKKKYLIISMVFSFLVIGLNEISLMFVDLVLGVVFVFTLITQRKINYSLLILLIFMAICSAIVVTSPGSAARATTYPDNHQFLYSLLKTIKATKRHLGDWLPTIIVSFLVFFDYFNKNITIETPKLFKVNLLIPSVIVFSFLVIGVFPVYYSLKWVPLRTVNVIYFFFLLGLIYLAFVFYFKLKSKHKDFLIFSKWTKIFLFVLIFIRLGGNNNVRTAYSDLLSGNAYKYDEAIKKRYQILLNSEEQKLSVPELTNLPKTIFFEDIKNSPKHWINQCYSSYFNIEEIEFKTSKP